MKLGMFAATALACGTIGGAAFAQDSEARILVDLVNVQGDLAQELGIDQTQVPMTVMAPLSVAAIACGEDVATLEAENLSGSSGGGTEASAAGGSDAGTDSGSDAGSDAGSDSAGGSGDAGTTGDGSAASGGTGDASSGGTADAEGDDSARGCIAKTSSPELAQVVQQDMSGATTSP